MSDQVDQSDYYFLMIDYEISADSEHHFLQSYK